MSDLKVEYKYADFVKYKNLALRMEKILEFKCAEYYGMPIGEGKGTNQRMHNLQYHDLKMFAYYEILRRLRTDSTRNKFINNRDVQDSLAWGGTQL